MLGNIHIKISDLINYNPKIGAALHELGILFHAHRHESLDQICRQRGLSAQKIMEKLEKAVSNVFPPVIDLTDVSIDLIVAYLRETHAIFIKKKLPYLNYLVENLPSDKASNKEIKLIFPHFLEEFIEHIYQEEDVVFGYILHLNQIAKTKKAPLGLKEQIESQAICHIQAQHEHDDEMGGLCELTYELQKNNPFCWEIEILAKATKQLQNELNLHAKIEDEILLPKALLLEKEAYLYL